MKDLSPSQHGQLFLPFSADDESTPFWTLPTNDSFVLGAIHFGRDIHLATPRTPSSLFRNHAEGELSVFGREVAIVVNSHTYELHCSIVGETFTFVGPQMESSYNIKEMMQGMGRIAFNHRSRSNLSWMHSVKDGINPGDVVVISLDTIITSQMPPTSPSADQFHGTTRECGGETIQSGRTSTWYRLSITNV
jgi:hypothetical protein